MRAYRRSGRNVRQRLELASLCFRQRECRESHAELVVLLTQVGASCPLSEVRTKRVPSHEVRLTVPHHIPFVYLRSLS